MPPRARTWSGRPPRRRKASPIARLRPFSILFVLGLIVIVVAGAFALLWPGFDPKVIDVIGNRMTSRDEILRAAAIDPNRNIWLQNSHAIAQRIEQIPYIGQAHVYRLMPSGVAIDVSERVPFAVVRDDSDSVVVDHDLRVLEPQETAAADRLPVFILRGQLDLEPGRFVTSSSMHALRDDYDAMIAAHIVPTELALDRYDGLVATVRGNIRVLLGDDEDLGKKLALVDPILAQIVRKQQRVAAIDLRAPNTPVLVYR